MTLNGRTEIIPFREPREVAGLAARLPAVFLPNERTADQYFRVLHRQSPQQEHAAAYYKAACQFSGWCEVRGLSDLAGAKPLHVAAYIEMLGLAKPHGEGLPVP